nr:ATP-binding protein [Neobacillus sp. Marseille-Q6967]
MATNIRFKSIVKNIILYIILTIVPSLTVSYYIASHIASDSEHQYRRVAQEHANSHGMSIENFLGETVGRLEMLATSLKLQDNNLINIEKILKETHGKDPRFSGFYWASPSGNILISTNPTSTTINLSDRPYFQKALKTEQTSISDAHIGRVTGRFIITIAQPVIEHGKIQGVLLASLRLDEMEKTIFGRVKNESIVIIDPANTVLMKAGTIPEGVNTVRSRLELTQIPWTITSHVVAETNLEFRNSILQYLVLFLTMTNILYLLTKYFLLQLRVKKEKELAEIHKLELISNLAASTAHEIRNPLTGIKGLVKLLSEDIQDKKAQTYFDVIQLEIDRINTIVSELLVLGKPTAHTLNIYNANDIVKEIEPIIHSEANFMNIGLSIQYAEVELPISCVKDHIKQVILNLVKNSLQAMPDGGSIMIKLEKRNESCVITVEDNGVGMDNYQLKKAFTPFYTLKKDGSGLGLTVCKRIIETYGGTITISSVLQKGTKVEMTLPLHNE